MTTQSNPPDYYHEPRPGEEDAPMTDLDWCRAYGLTPETPSPDAGLFKISDDSGRLLTDMEQPLPGSVILVQGEHGTAWQRHFTDMLWHSTRGGRPRTWREMLAFRGLRLAYCAPVRETGTVL